MWLNELPWERKRAGLALQVFAIQASEFVRGLDRIAPHQRRERLQWWDRFQMYGISAQLPTFRGVELAFANRAAQTSSLAAMEWPQWDEIRREISNEYLRRVARSLERTRLALIAYHLDHDEYPPTLKELVPKYTEALEADPFSGEPFQYTQAGFPLRLKLDYLHVSPRHLAWHGRLPVGTPAIWAVGTGNVSLAETSELLQADRPGEAEGSDAGRNVETETLLELRAVDHHVHERILFALPNSDAYRTTAERE